MWMKAGQVAPRGLRGIGYCSKASLMSLLLELPILRAILVYRVFTPYVWPCYNKFLQEYLTVERLTTDRAAVHSLQVAWLTAVSFGTYCATLPSQLKPTRQLLLTRTSHRPLRHLSMCPGSKLTHSVWPSIDLKAQM